MSSHASFIIPKSPHLPPPDWSLLERTLLERGWIVPADNPDDTSPDDENSPMAEEFQATRVSQHYRAGPGMAGFFYGNDADDRTAMTLTFLECDHEPFVIIGEGTVAPSLPGSDEPIEEMPPYDTYMDFIGATCEDLDTVWTNPDDGREYHAMDLDWDKGFGIARRLLMLEGCEIDYDRFAMEIGELADTPMTDVHRHL